MAALIVLNITIFFLPMQKTPDSTASMNSGINQATTVTDKVLVNTASSLPGIVVFALSGSVFFIIFVALALATCAARQKDGFADLFWGTKSGKNLETFKHV